MPTKQAALIEWLKANPGRYRAEQLNRYFRDGRSTVNRALAELQADGWAEKRLAGRNTYWIIRRLPEPED